MLAVVPEARSIENAEAIVEEVRRRVASGVPLLLTSDEYSAYEGAIERTFGVPVPATGGLGRPRLLPRRATPEGLAYATVHKHRQGHRVVAVDRRLIFGTASSLEAALARSEVNTSFLERQNGADRGRNARGGPQDVSVQQGLAGARGGDLPDDGHLQLLLGGPHAAGEA